jgi:hypothetical protein
MKIIRMLFIAALAALSVPAAADLVVVSKAHEVSLENIRLPGSTNGTLSFKPCETCDYQTVRVTAATRYEANEQSFDLEAFRKELEGIRNPREETATVLHHLKSDTIVAVQIIF